MFEIPDTIGCTFQNLYFIVEAFCRSICNMGIFEGVQYLFTPMSVGFGTLLEFRKLRLFGCGDPFKEFFPLFGILFILTNSAMTLHYLRRVTPTKDTANLMNMALC